MPVVCDHTSIKAAEIALMAMVDTVASATCSTASVLLTVSEPGGRSTIVPGVWALVSEDAEPDCPPLPGAAVAVSVALVPLPAPPPQAAIKLAVNIAAQIPMGPIVDEFFMAGVAQGDAKGVLLRVLWFGGISCDYLFFGATRLSLDVLEVSKQPALFQRVPLKLRQLVPS